MSSAPRLKPVSPKGLAAPLARYSPGIEVPAGARLLFVSGQLGIDTDGATPEGAEAQAELYVLATGFRGAQAPPAALQ